MSNAPFGKFIKKENNAQKKEKFKQEKRQVRKEKEAYFAEKKRRERAGGNEFQTGKTRYAPVSMPRTTPAGAKPAPGSRFKKEGDRPAAGPRTNAETRIALKKERQQPGGAKAQPAAEKPQRTPYKTGAAAAKPTAGGPRTKPSFSKPGGPVAGKPEREPHAKKTFNTAAKNAAPAPAVKKENTGEMPLNKYLSHSGVCSRREAAGVVKDGKVTVNGKPVTEPGFKVTASDTIKINNKAIHLQHNLVYVLLNKPKDFLTTMSDPEGRKTIMDIVKGATEERIYPVGRLDRNTTGVLLLTNDGELAQKLTHPSHGVKKIYEVKLDRAVTKADYEKLQAGITLEDGFIAPDSLAYADPKDKSVIGIEIHSGRNRIVRRMFEHLRYDVKNLDRVLFAGLSKKNVERGRWRFLSEREIRNLKFLNASSQKKSAKAAVK
jgi:23S rRNA pseudouridine2605 synthase